MSFPTEHLTQWFLRPVVLWPRVAQICIINSKTPQKHKHRGTLSCFYHKPTFKIISLQTVSNKSPIRSGHVPQMLRGVKVYVFIYALLRFFLTKESQAGSGMRFWPSGSISVDATQDNVKTIKAHINHPDSYSDSTRRCWCRIYTLINLHRVLKYIFFSGNMQQNENHLEYFLHS